MENMGLSGNRRIVFDELFWLLMTKQRVSLDVLAERANCHPVTVSRALSDLQDWGLVRVTPRGRGRPARYEILEEEVCYSN